MKAQQFHHDMVESHSFANQLQRFLDNISIGMRREGIMYMGMEFEDGSVLGACQEWDGNSPIGHFEVFATRQEATNSWLSGPNCMGRSRLYVAAMSSLIEQKGYVTYNGHRPRLGDELYCDTACE